MKHVSRLLTALRAVAGVASARRSERGTPGGVEFIEENGGDPGGTAAKAATEERPGRRLGHGRVKREHPIKSPVILTPIVRD